MAKMRKHWYFITIHECPACGRSREYRERRYTPKPKSGSKRYNYEQIYDWCLV